ncbi:hypothetical protein ACLKMY_33855 [Paraburkholderia mimosarum]|uniref:hypothetical protein n=1 Tax=Paraburkholderia mimosarum TaxID=312026 RepID=UPI00041AC33A|nr:hypothetical protein [Paraburkholderia mimosarum]
MSQKIDHAKMAERVRRAELLAELNRKADEALTALAKHYEALHGIKPVKIHSGRQFGQSAFTGSGKIPGLLFEALLAGKGIDPALKREQRHELLIPEALAAIGAQGEYVNVSIWGREQHENRIKRWRLRMEQHGYAYSDEDKTLGHFLKRIQAGKVDKNAPDSKAPRWSDGSTLWFNGERIRVTWRGDRPQCNRTKGSVWKLLGEYAQTRVQQRALVADAKRVQAEIDERSRKAVQAAADEETLADIFADQLEGRTRRDEED